MPEAIVSASLEVSRVTRAQREQLKALATWRRLGRISRGMERELRLWGETADRIILPRAMTAAVRRAIPSLQAPADERLTLPPIEWPWRGPTLFAYQRRAVGRLLAQQGGTLLAPPGSGKTEMALAFLSKAQQPALWLVHDRGLAFQALQRAQRLFPDLPPSAWGRIWEGRRSIGTHLTVAVIQTLVKHRFQLEDRFGAVVVDEAHHAASPTLAEVVCRFPAAYRLGLTASAEREDGLEPVVYAIFGPPVEVTIAELIAAGRYVVPVLRTLYYHGLNSVSGEWNSIQRACLEDMRRNWGICSVVRDEVATGRRVLVLVNWVAHARLLSMLLSQRFRIPAAAIVGEVGPARRGLLLHALQKWPGRALVATRLADEGLDLPSLDCAFLAVPGKSRTRLKQRTGRLMRIDPTNPGKRGVLYDLVDTKHKSLLDQYERRREVYREMLVPVDGPAAPGAPGKSGGGGRAGVAG